MAAVSILPGRNVWLLARTDRDGPSPDTAILTAAAWLNRLFPDTGLPAPPPASPKGPAGASRYYLGKARPVDISASQTRPTLPKGLRGWSVADLPPEYGVDAVKPWYVLVDFDWRGQPFDLDVWPVRTVGTFGWVSSDPTLKADWLLLDARHVSETPSRQDGDWTGDAGKTVQDALPSVGLLALLGLWLYFGGGSSRRR